MENTKPGLTKQLADSWQEYPSTLSVSELKKYLMEIFSPKNRTEHKV